jgi:hypothetical protein
MPHAEMDPSLDDYYVGLVEKAKAWAVPLRPPRAVHAEMPLPALRLGDDELHQPYGTPDLGYDYDDAPGIFVHLIEYKYGPNEPLEDHLAAQMGGYAAMVLEAFEGSCVHCSVFHAPTGKEWSRAYTQEDLPGLKNWYRAIIDNALAEKPLLAPGPQCVWCPGRGRCPAVHHEMEIVSNAYGRDFLMCPKDRGEFLEKARRVKAMAELVESEAKRILQEDPKAIEGWRVVSYRSTRIKDAKKAHARLTRKARIPQAQAWECFTAAKGKLKRLCGDAYSLLLSDLEVPDEEESVRLVRSNERPSDSQE